MDKNVYNMKAEKIQKQARRGDYETAAKICDTIDWSQVRSVRMLTLVSSVYENVKEYDRAIDILLMAYEEAPVGRRFLYKLTELAIAAGSIHEAEEYYKSYIKDAGEDASRYLLRYELAEAKGEPLDKRIAILETYRRQEFDEEWACRLAELYQKAGRKEDCVRLCDEIILWFGVGPCVDRAMEIKEQFEPLTASQKEHREHKEVYEEKLAQVARESEAEEAAAPVKSFASVTPPEQEALPEEEVQDEEELPRVAISEDTPVVFDESAFISDEEEMQQEAETLFGSSSDRSDKTRKIAEGQDISKTRVFAPVKENEEEAFSIGSFVESVMADARKSQKHAASDLENEAATDRELLKKTAESHATAPAPSIFEELPEQEPEACIENADTGMIESTGKDVQTPAEEKMQSTADAQTPGAEYVQSTEDAETLPAAEKIQQKDAHTAVSENAQEYREGSEAASEAAAAKEPEREIEMPLSHMDRPQAAKIILRAPEEKKEEPQPEETEEITADLEAEETAASAEPAEDLEEVNADLPEESETEAIPEDAFTESEAKRLRETEEKKRQQREQLRREQLQREAEAREQERREQLSKHLPEAEQKESRQRKPLAQETGERRKREPSRNCAKELLFVGCSNAPDSLNMAVDALHRAYEKEHGELTQVAKISSTKLNSRGLVRSLSNLEGKDLIIDGASALSDEILREIVRVREELDPDKYFVLLDRPGAIRILKERMADLFPDDMEEVPSVIEDETLPDPVRPDQEEEQPPREKPAKKAPMRREEKAPAPEASEKTHAAPKKTHVVYPVDGELSEEQFAGCIRRYAESIDCVIDDGAMEAIYDVIDEILDDGDHLTKAVAEEVVEDAADEAERHSLRNLFGSRYDKEGKLILKARHFR